MRTSNARRRDAAGDDGERVQPRSVVDDVNELVSRVASTW